MRINHNSAAMNTYSKLSSAQGAQAKSLEKLSSGLRINRAGDDAAGLAISEKMRAQVGGLNQATRNAQDGISLIQTAEGGLNETHSILQRMRELTVQSANDTNTVEDRGNIQDEFDQLAKEITRVSTTTEFNGKALLDGSATAVSFQIGANSGQSMTLGIDAMDAATLGVGTGTDESDTVGIDISTASVAEVVEVVESGTFGEDGYVAPVAGVAAVVGADFDAALTAIDAAIGTVSSERSKLGATQNRLDHTINNLTTTSENLSAAESRVRDVDMAKEMMEFTKNNILNQASTAMLAQANQMPQGVLQLLG